MANWRDKILEQFVPKVSKLSLVSDPDNLLTEEKMAVALRNQGFDILEFNDAIEFGFAYESRYRSIWDKGLDTELLVILHSKNDNLNTLPFDLLEAGRKFYFNIAEVFPVFSPNILDSLDRTLLDSLYDSRDKFPRDMQGPNSTIDFILRYVYKIDIEAINNELDIIKILLNIHFTNFDIPLIFRQRLEYLLSWKRIITSCQLDSLIYDKDLFVEFLMDKHIEFINNLPEVQLANKINKNTKEIDSLLKLIEAEDFTQLSNHNDWIKYAWKLARLTSLVYNTNNTEQIDKLILMSKKANVVYENWITDSLTGLRTIPYTHPAMVHHIPHYLAYQYRQTKSPIALLVIDGLALDQWITLQNSLQGNNLRFIENAVFAWIPTLTSVSRQAIFSGKSPYEYEKYMHTTSKEDNYWSLFWENNELSKECVVYKKNIDKTLNIHDLDNILSNNKNLAVGLVLNKVDDIMHGMEMGMAAFHNQINLYGQSYFLRDLLVKLLDNNFSVWITSDHGNTECIGKGQPHEASIAKSRGERVRVYKNKELLQYVKDKYSWSNFWKPTGLPDEYYPLFATENNAFLQEKTKAISHGGCSIQETIVPFIKVERK
jgi:hypothetical protein